MKKKKNYIMKLNNIRVSHMQKANYISHYRSHDIVQSDSEFHIFDHNCAFTRDFQTVYGFFNS